MIHRRTDPERFFFFFFFFMLLLLLLLLGSMRRCERRRETRVVLMSESRTKLVTLHIQPRLLLWIHEWDT